MCVLEGGGSGWLQGGVSQPGCRVGGIDQRWSQRERGHFFGVSQWGERLGTLPAGLTALSRNVCDWRPGWGCALSYSTEAKQPDPQDSPLPLLHRVFLFSLFTALDHKAPRCARLCRSYQTSRTVPFSLEPSNNRQVPQTMKWNRIHCKTFSWHGGLISTFTSQQRGL